MRAKENNEYVIYKKIDTYRWNLLLCSAAIKGGTCSRISLSTAACWIHMAAFRALVSPFFNEMIRFTSFNVECAGSTYLVDMLRKLEIMAVVLQCT
jgi:hypothetical protein